MITEKIREFLRKAIEEDVGKHDITSETVFPTDFPAEAALIAKEEGVLAGMDFFKEVFRLIERKLKFQGFPDDGVKVRKGQNIGKISGSVKSILKGERVGLNVLSHLSGISTLTAAFVSKTGGKIAVLDTRKTLPGLRYFEKYAVRAGGGKNHRMKMDELVLIKDNHINAWVLKAGVSRIEAIRFLTGNARSRAAGKKLEVEIENCAEAVEAHKAGADIVMFDHSNPSEIRKFVRLAGRKKPVIEISGNINLKNITKFTALPIDWISVGALTNSAPALDFSLKIKNAR
jgi:nicotinate-nucleotide pyrophosphorylase (carboxylating)